MSSAEKNSFSNQEFNNYYRNIKLIGVVSIIGLTGIVHLVSSDNAVRGSKSSTIVPSCHEVGNATKEYSLKDQDILGNNINMTVLFSDISNQINGDENCSMGQLLEGVAEVNHFNIDKVVNGVNGVVDFPTNIVPKDNQGNYFLLIPVQVSS